MEDRFVILRQLLDVSFPYDGHTLPIRLFWAGPSRPRQAHKRWERVVELFDSWPAGSERDVAIEYANAHMESWHPNIRVSYRFSPDAAVWPLVRRIVLSRQDAHVLEALCEHPHITHLGIASHEIDALPQCLVRMEHLKGLEFQLPKSSFSLQNLEQLPHLQSLCISNCFALDDFEAIAGLSQLKTLVLTQARKLKTFAPLRTLAQLEELHLTGTYDLLDTDGLGELSGLRYLALVCNSHMQTIAGLSQLRALEIGHFATWSELVGLEGGECLSELRILHLMKNPRLRSIENLLYLEKLHLLSVSDCGDVADFEGAARDCSQKMEIAQSHPSRE